MQQRQSSKKPAIIIARFPYEAAWGGEEQHTLLLASRLREHGFEVIFFGNCPILSRAFHERGYKVKVVKGGKMIVTPFELLKSLFIFPILQRNMRRAFRALKKEYDVKALYCLSLNEKLFLTAEAVKAGIAVTWVEHQQIRDWLLKNPWQQLYLKNSARVKIVPISLSNQKALLELGVKKENIVQIINGVDVAGISALGRKTKKGLLMAANRFVPKKGLLDFISAAELVVKKVQGVSVLVIGEGEEQEQIEDLTRRRLAGTETRIMPPLHRKNWYEFLSRADVYVSCARDASETFSLNTAEALAAGCKVVVTRCSGIADYLDDGRDALLAEPGDPKDLAAKMIEALRAPERMRKNAMETAKKKFDQERMLEQYEKILLRGIFA